MQEVEFEQAKLRVETLNNNVYTHTEIYLTMSRMTDLESKILDLLHQGPVTPDEVSDRLEVAWATAQGHLLRLVGKGTVSVARKGRVNVYFLKGLQKLTLNAPPWARTRSLEDLSEELKRYFPANLSAAEMIRRERRQA